MLSKYSIQARLFPTIISAIPILLFQYAFLGDEIAKFFEFLGNLKFAGDITLSVVILYFASHLNRFISKNFFERKEMYMPTTDFLLSSNDEYSPKYKLKIYGRLESDFALELPKEDEHKDDELQARRRISEAMSLARKKVGKGKLLLQHNIEYGFWRNLVGGSILAILFSIINVYLSFSTNANSIFIFSIVCLALFLSVLIFSKLLISRVSMMYARVLIQEYMAS